MEVFVACVKSRFGEPYDTYEALSLGEIDEPAKQMCSSLISECLPEPVQREIANARQLGLLRRFSVSVHSPPGAEKTRVIISPNGFAQYYGTLKGRKLNGTDIWDESRPLEISVKSVVHQHGWKAVLMLAAAGVLTAGVMLYIFIFRRS